MFERNTDRDWELLGQEDPYFGVCTHPKFRRDNLNEHHREDFFSSGRNHIAKVMETIRTHFDPAFTIKRALDFGCGVGRLVLPLSDVAGEVTGVDVSPAMLSEAQKNIEQQQKKNITLVQADDHLSKLDGLYDFIHSYIVFQHIPVRRGKILLNRLLEHLAPGGIGVLHFTYDRVSHRGDWILWVKRYVPLAAMAINLINGRSLRAPEIHMHLYDLNRIMNMLQRAGIENLHNTFTNHSGELGILIYFRKPNSRDD
jgi:SAM-dependent methyltransferase